MKIYGEYDVVVVGGGAAGTSAAISAAREGAKTCLIETLGAVGGMLNVSGPPGWAFCHLFNNNGQQTIGGIVSELHNDLLKRDCAQPLPEPQFRNQSAPAYIDVDWGGLLLFEKLREAGVQCLLHSMAVDVVKEGDTVAGVVVENCSGRMAVMGKVIIEATGEGDIAVMAGVPFEHIDRTVEELDPPSITFHMDGVDWDECTKYYKAHPDQFLPVYLKGHAALDDSKMGPFKKRTELLATCDNVIDLVRRGVTETFDYDDLSHQALANGDMHPWGDLGHYFTYRQGGHFQPVFQHTAQIPDCDTNDITEYSDGEVEARRQVVMAIPAIRKYLPGYQNAYLTRITVGMRTREGRHMIGDYQMQADDVENNRRFDDCIAKCCMGVTVGGPFHSAATPGVAMNIDPNKRMIDPHNGSFDIPYRAMVSKGVEGMLMTGKLLSCTPDFKRDQLPDNMVWGQAAGLAAALCIKNGKTPRELEADTSELTALIKKYGGIVDGVD